jgi:hypothetical protein
MQLLNMARKAFPSVSVPMLTASIILFGAFNAKAAIAAPLTYQFDYFVQQNSSTNSYFASTLFAAGTHGAGTLMFSPQVATQGTELWVGHSAQYQAGVQMTLENGGHSLVVMQGGTAIVQDVPSTEFVYDSIIISGKHPEISTSPYPSYSSSNSARVFLGSRSNTFVDHDLNEANMSIVGALMIEGNLYFENLSDYSGSPYIQLSNLRLSTPEIQVPTPTSMELFLFAVVILTATRVKKRVSSHKQ